MQLLKTWPIDETKKGRDLGEHLREEVIKAFSPENSTKLDSDKCRRNYEALTRISKDYYRNTYPKTTVLSATGLDKEGCKKYLTNEYLKHGEESRPSIIVGFIKNLFKKSK